MQVTQREISSLNMERSHLISEGHRQFHQKFQCGVMCPSAPNRKGPGLGKALNSIEIIPEKQINFG